MPTSSKISSTYFLEQKIFVPKICSVSKLSDINCYCLITDPWGPQFFLLNDFLPCSNSFPSVPPIIFKNADLFEKFITNMNDKKVVLVTHPIFSSLSKQQKDRLSEICYTLNDIFICN